MASDSSQDDLDIVVKTERSIDEVGLLEYESTLREVSITQRISTSAVQ